MNKRMSQFVDLSERRRKCLQVHVYVGLVGYEVKGGEGNMKLVFI